MAKTLVPEARKGLSAFKNEVAAEKLLNEREFNFKSSLQNQ